VNFCGIHGLYHPSNPSIQVASSFSQTSFSLYETILTI
jgi:hypothetical protein